MKNEIGRRRGIVLICVLACCLTALSLGTLAVRMSLRSVRECRQTLRYRQAQWLLVAGVQRASQKLNDSTYTGEVWELPKSVTGSEAARIRIEVAALEAGVPVNPPANSVNVIVEFGGVEDAALMIRQSLKLAVVGTE